MRLRQMEFSIEDIAAVLGECDDEADILNYLERQRNVLHQRIHPSHRQFLMVLPPGIEPGSAA